MGVVTEAQGASAGDGKPAEVAVGLGVTAVVGVEAPHAVTANSQQPINAVVASPLTTSPATFAAQNGRRTPNGRLGLQTRGTASMAFRHGARLGPDIAPSGGDARSLSRAMRSAWHHRHVVTEISVFCRQSSAVVEVPALFLS